MKVGIEKIMDRCVLLWKDRLPKYERISLLQLLNPQGLEEVTYRNYLGPNRGLPPAISRQPEHFEGHVLPGSHH